MKLALALSLPFALALGGCALSGSMAPSGSAAASRHEAGSLTGRVRIMKGRRYKTSHDDAVVYLVGVPEKVRGGRHKVAEIRQVDKSFVPDVSVVQKGTTIAFPNDDREFHNVYSLSPACSDGSGSGFDLGEYKSGTSKSVRCSRAGEVAVFCNIHPEMAAKVLVVETRFYARADNDGVFQIKNVPPGTYTYVAWQPWGKSHTGKITIPSGEAAEIDVTLKEGRKPQPSYCADGSLRGAYGCKD
jgi:plastocyanin